MQTHQGRIYRVTTQIYRKQKTFLTLKAYNGAIRQLLTRIIGSEIQLLLLSASTNPDSLATSQPTNLPQIFKYFQQPNEKFPTSTVALNYPSLLNGSPVSHYRGNRHF
ncbi:hypothetical protein ATW73_04590 [Oenococcus oeni]|nr:hypothetical protein X463_09380 [Oenococcus oeni S22]OIK62701.1 hypothetical protein ATW62_04515 [Oenococcus oeni]OIK80812.1 hypothetical protein ATW73_04590 [Oenococcus oeni]OIL90174.1 hypothetical protein ATX42_04525 [Oenococcus oeni]OIM66314.1 hypothetical protein ATX88_04460 [Oenococcus oeni]